MPKRPRVFGDGKPLPLDRNAKARIMALARAISRTREPGHAYGPITAKGLAVLEALLWTFHNARSGLCFPSYEAIAAAAGCARSMVKPLLDALEAAGILSWVNRITRTRVQVGGRPAWRVVTTSNAYRFLDPGQPAAPRPASKSDFQTGTNLQDSFSSSIDPNSPIELALASLGAAFSSAVAVGTA